MPNLNTSILANIPLLVPPDHLLEHFERIVRPMQDRIDQAAQESETLAAVRDTLLPKLISGDLRVKDAERVVEKVA